MPGRDEVAERAVREMAERHGYLVDGAARSGWFARLRYRLGWWLLGSVR